MDFQLKLSDINTHQRVLQNDNAKILRDFSVRTNDKLEHNQQTRHNC